MRTVKPPLIGLITGAVMILASTLAFYVFHVPAQSRFQLVVYMIYTAGIVWSLLQFHQRKTDEKKFRDYFSEGFRAFIVVVLLMVLYTFIFVKSNPHMIDGFIEENNKALAAEGNRTQAEIQNNATQIRSYFVLTMVMGALIMYLVIGALISVVGAGFLSQKKTA